MSKAKDVAGKHKFNLLKSDCVCVCLWSELTDGASKINQNPYLFVLHTNCAFMCFDPAFKSEKLGLALCGAKSRNLQPKAVFWIMVFF